MTGGRGLYNGTLRVDRQFAIAQAALVACKEGTNSLRNPPESAAHEPTYSPPRNPPRENQSACQGKDLPKTKTPPRQFSRVKSKARGGMGSERGPWT